jgi:hypothetical protein
MNRVMWTIFVNTRETDLLTAGMDIPGLHANRDMGIPSSLTDQLQKHFGPPQHTYIRGDLMSLTGFYAFSPFGANANRFIRTPKATPCAPPLLRAPFEWLF